MKKENFSDALDYIDFELVDEFVKEKETLQMRRVRRKAIATFVPIAACLVILLNVGAAMLGYQLGFNASNGNYVESPEQMKVFFEKEGIFVFEYEGKLYQALVMPIGGDNGFETIEGESVSIKNVGEMISKVSVMDKNGNVATMEIYSIKSDNTEGEDGSSDILLKLDSGYFLAKKINKNKN